MKSKKNKGISMDEEMMMWCSYRYAIGRHTYVNSLARYIGENFYDKLTDERLAFTAKDIRKCIEDNLGFLNSMFKYDGSVSYENRKPLEDLLQYFYDNNITKDDLANIRLIECYQEKYGDNQPKKYSVSYLKNPLEHYCWTNMDIDDLLIWMDLASLFDKKNYKLVHVKNGDVEEDVVCISSWTQAMEEIPDKPGYYKTVNFKWVPIYKPIDNVFNNTYIPSDYVVSVKDNS